jgi:hypothetical protein
MKKLITILLLALFVFDITGFFLVFNIQRSFIRNNIKHQIRQELPREHLTVIIDSGRGKSEIKWREKDEFRYKGEMYDVVRSGTGGNGITYYYCIDDKAETQLYRKMEKLIENTVNNRDNSAMGKTYLIKLYQSVYSLVSNRFVILLQPSDIASFESINLYQSQYSDVDLPPPKFIFTQITQRSIFLSTSKGDVFMFHI